jgi:hypothetical protein
MTITTFSSRLDTMNRYINYLPGTGEPLGEEEMRIALIEAQPDWMKTVMEEANYEWDDLEKHSKQEVLQYLGRLLLIQESIKDAKIKSKNKFKNNGNKGKSPEKKGTNAVKHCNYCNKNYHTEEQCRKKKRDEQMKNKNKNSKNEKDKKAESDFMIEELTDTLIEDFGLKEEVSHKIASTIATTTTSHPRYVDHTTLADLLTEVIVYIKSEESSSRDDKIKKLFRVLIDTGCSRSLVKLASLPEGMYENRRQTKETIWKTNAGVYLTKYEVPLRFSLPEFAPSKEIEFTMAVDETEKTSKYDMVLGRDILRALGIDILFSNGKLSWDGITIPMKSTEKLTRLLQSPSDASIKQEEDDYFLLIEENFSIQLEGEHSKEANLRAQRILDAKYTKGDIETTVENECKHLSYFQRQKLKILLYEHEILFDGTLGRWDTKPVNFEIRPGEKPYHGKAFPIPQVHEATLKKEVQRLVQLGVLERCADSEWAAPTFIIPKKDGTV